jgi:hypothetical protein
LFTKCHNTHPLTSYLFSTFGRGVKIDNRNAQFRVGAPDYFTNKGYSNYRQVFNYEGEREGLIDGDNEGDKDGLKDLLTE